MKIGVLTYHRAVNYGAFLQAYALCQRLNQEEDIEAELIDFQCEKEVKLYNPYQLKKNLVWIIKKRNINKVIDDIRKHRAFVRARKQMPLSSEHVISDDCGRFVQMVKDQYDVIVAGSDEIWKVNSYRGFPTPYWLAGDLGCRKFSYAASARTSFSLLSEENQAYLKNALADFEYIGVRDEDTLTEVKKFSDRHERIHLCCDPSFIYDFQADGERGRALLRKRWHVDTEKKCVGLMIRSPEIVKALREKYGDQIELISLFERNPGCVNTVKLTPFEWMDVIAGLDFVITSYFHGMCFSIINQTPFFSVDNRTEKQDGSKMFDLLGKEGMADRYGRTAKDCLESGALLQKADAAFAGEPLDSSALVQRYRENFKDFVACVRGEKAGSNGMNK